MGWCTELINSSILVSDDIMDRSETRRNVPCWYKLPDIGLSAVMDAMVLEDGAYMLLHKYFRDHPCYMLIVEHFHAMNLMVCIGQSLDARVTCRRTPHWQHITRATYRTITEYKVEYFGYVFPVRAAMYLAGIQDDALHRQVESTLRLPGYLLQVKNDFLDCFGNTEKTGKTLYGDIREGKCAWPAVVAFERANLEQRAVLERCYGQADDQSVQAVMDVYRALDMPGVFVSHEEEMLNQLAALTEQLDPRLPKELIYNILGMA